MFSNAFNKHFIRILFCFEMLTTLCYEECSATAVFATSSQVFFARPKLETQVQTL